MAAALKKSAAVTHYFSCGALRLGASRTLRDVETLYQRLYGMANYNGFSTFTRKRK
jgi:hypothetical protein